MNNNNNNNNSNNNSNRTEETPVTPVNPRKEQHPLLILKLPGNLTGDLWHFAAAIALYREVPTPLIEATPLTAVSVIEYTWQTDPEKKKAAEEEAAKLPKDDKDGRRRILVKSGQYVLSHYLKRGIVSFEYLRSIGAPTLLVRLGQATASGSPDEQTYTKVFGDYALGLLKVLVKTQQAGWGDVYAQTEETVFEFTPDFKPVYPPANEGVNALWAKYDKKVIVPKTIGLDDISRKATAAKPLIWDNKFKMQDGPFTATAITMMYLSDPATRAARINTLQKQLSGDPKGQWWLQARSLQKQLMDIYQKLGSKKKILLFNYRLGDVNRQHDANLSLFRQVSELAAKENMQCVPIFVSASPLEAEAVNKMCGDMSIELYAKDVHYDKRYTAAFWTIVANEMQKEVFGIIGGRSGSMDIATFMGVNCCEWDEPLCDPVLSKLYKDLKYVNQNIDQCLRLFNQIYNVSIAYLDPKSSQSFKEAHGEFETITDVSSTTNAYTSLIVNEVITWLRRPFSITTPTVFPTFPQTSTLDGRTVIDIMKYERPVPFRNLVTATMNKLENENAKIKAVALRAMGFDTNLLTPDEMKGIDLKSKPKMTAEEREKFQKAKAEEGRARAKAKKDAEDAALKAMKEKEKEVKATQPPTSTEAQSLATLTPEDALLTFMGSDGGEDAGDVIDTKHFLIQ